MFAILELPPPPPALTSLDPPPPAAESPPGLFAELPDAVLPLDELLLFERFDEDVLAGRLPELLLFELLLLFPTLNEQPITKSVRTVTARLRFTIDSFLFFKVDSPLISVLLS